MRTIAGEGCLVVEMAPRPLGRVFNGSDRTIHGIRVEMKARREGRRSGTRNPGKRRTM